MPLKKSSVLLVDDNRDLTTVLARFIDAEPDLTCLGQLDTADGLLDRMAEQTPDVVLLDLTMPGRDPMDAMMEAVARFPSARFVVMSGYDDSMTIDRAADGGAWGFVSKQGDVQAIIAAIRAALAGEVSLKLR